MDSLKLVVVDDNADILEMLDYNLRQKGYQSHAFTEAKEALKFINHSNTDLVITDWMMPEINGLELLKQLREQQETAHIPVIMLTCIEDEQHIGEAFEKGVEDYLIKPFKINELSAKISRVAKRDTSKTEQLITQTENLKINSDTFEAFINTEKLTLTFSEFRFLEAISARPNKVFTREQLIEQLNGTDYLVTARTVDVLVVGLRKKLGAHKNLIQTVRSVGYKFVPFD